MKQGQETNQIWTQEAGTHDTHNRTLTHMHTIIIYLYSCNEIHCEYPTFLPQYHGAVSVTTVNPW